MQRSYVWQMRAVLAYLGAVEVKCGRRWTRVTEQAGATSDAAAAGAIEAGAAYSEGSSHRAHCVRLSYGAMSRCLGCDCGTARSRGRASGAGTGRRIERAALRCVVLAVLLSVFNLSAVVLCGIFVTTHAPANGRATQVVKLQPTGSLDVRAAWSVGVERVRESATKGQHLQFWP